MPGVTLVIVNWNGGDLLAECLRCVRAQTRLPDRVLLVDNGSTDGSIERLAPWERLQVLAMGDNLGFAAANNHAIALCRTEFVALLNPDAFAAPDWLELLLEAAAVWPQAAAFGSRQLCHDDGSRLDGVGDRYHVSGLAWREAHGSVQRPEHLLAGEIFSACAAAALYRRDALLGVGGFDESFFCYMEDVDLGFRLRLAGHVARYVPQAVVSHVGGASSGGGRSAFSVFHGHRNLEWTLVKNMPGALFWLLLPLHLLADAAMLLVCAARGQLAVLLRAKAQALRGLPRVWRQRRQIQQDRKVSMAQIWRVLDKSLWPRR